MPRVEENMGRIAFQVYKGLTDAGEDKDRATIIATGFEGMESRIQLKTEASATKEDIRATELRLLAEIEKSRTETELVRKEVKELDIRQMASIERFHRDFRDLDRRVSHMSWTLLVGMTGIATLIKVLSHFGI